jgi:hypothetical protein
MDKIKEITIQKKLTVIIERLPRSKSAFHIRKKDLKENTGTLSMIGLPFWDVKVKIYAITFFLSPRVDVM